MSIKQLIKRASVVLLAIVVAATTFGCDFFGNKTAEHPKPHLITAAQRETNPIRPITTNEKQRAIFKHGTENWELENEMDELMATVSLGYKPLLSGASSAVQGIYNGAVSILNDIILNDMSNYERVHAIYDYLCYYVEYDFELYEDYLTGDFDEYSPAFDARGAIINKKAVCEGISEAFMLLCGIENIRAVMVSGTAMSDGQYIAHAWNRVLLEGKWYNIDCTYGSLKVSTAEGEGVQSFLNHAYFLVDTQSMTQHIPTHIWDVDTDFSVYAVFSEQMAQYNADNYYGFYKKTLMGVLNNSIEILYEADNQEELANIFKYISEKKTIASVEIRINFGGDQKMTALRLAYSEVSNSDYLADGGTSFLINNVVYCFIYSVPH